MSRVIQQIATVQFQVDNRKVTASMNALQTEAESLNGKIDAVKLNIKALGDVPADNKFLLEYQKQLRQLNSDLKDVTAAQRDLMKGVKAADQLWKAAQTQDIESLSIKAIKAGQNGLRKRMENLRPELGGDEQKMYDAYKAVIDEADRVMNVFKSNYATVVQTIRDGGIVSEQVMKSTRDALRDLMEAEKEGTAEHRQLAQQYDFLNESLTNVAEMRRREKGEIVNANDARREALKLTEDGIAAARRERDMADAVIAGIQQQKSDLDQLRRFHEDRIAQTESEIAANQRLEEAEQDRLADVEKAMRYNENEDRKEASRLRKKADAARDEAEAKKEAYEQQAEQEKLLRQHVKDTGDEVANLKGEIEALGKTEAKPKVDVEGVKKDIAALKAEYEKLTSDWMAAGKMQNPHQMYDTYEEFAKNVNHHGILKDLTYFDEDYNKYLDEMRKRKSEMKRQLVGDEILQSPAYRDREKIAKSGYGMNDPRLMEMNEEYFFGAKEAKDIIEGEKAYDAACERVANAIRDAHKKLREAFESGIQPEQVEGVAKQIQRLQSLYLGITDLGSANRESMMGSGKDIVKNIFGGDFDKEIAKIEAQIKRVMTLAEKNKYDYYDEHFGKEREDSLVKQQAIEKRQGEIKAELAQKEKIVTEAQQQSTTATNDQTEAIKKQEEELGKLEQKLKRLEESRDGYQNDVKESLKAVKDMGLTEENLADDAKVREAIEKKVLEIMEAQAKVWQEIAEQRKKLADEVKMSDLGGTKADQEFYKKHAGNYDTDQYGSPDDVIERIAHLERLKKIKNGKRFNPDEDWDDDDELDEDAPIMSDKEKQAINDELRFLKQHIREELLKTIHEVGDINKAVEQYTGGDGVSEDAKFGEQLNDKIGEIKDKIEERIETTLDRYGEMLTEDRDEDAKLTKEQLTSHVSQHMKAVKENHGFNRSWLEETQDDIKTTNDEIAAKKLLIDQMKQQAQATKESTTADQQSVDVAKQKAELEGQLADATKNHTKAQKDFEAQQEKTNKAQEKAYKAQEESVALNEKAATAEEKVAHQEERHAEAMDQQSEHLRQIRAEGERLLDQYEQQKTEIQAVDKAWADADVKQGEAEARKAQNQELTIKSLDDSIRKLKEANAVIDTNSDEWEENTRIIRNLQQAQDEINQKQKEMMGEWMSYAEAEKFAAQAGTEGFIATGQQMQQAQQALERRRDALIKSIQVRRQEKNMTDEQKKALAAEEAQLDKVNAELKKMKFEMDNTNMSAKRMNEILDNPSAAKNIEELGQAVKRAQAQLKVMEDTVGNTNEEYKEMAQKTKEAAQRQKELEVQFKASASAFDKAWSRLKTYVGLYVGASVAMQKLTSTMGDLMDLSDKMGEVRKTTGFTADEVGRLSGELKKFDTRTTLNGLLDLSVAAGQLGLKTEEDVLGFTEAANKLMVALPEMGREGATEMLKVALATGEIDKIRKQMEQGLIDGSSATAVAMEKVGSTIDRLRATSAATAPAITDFVKRVGAVGAQSGITIDQVAALGSTVDALGMRVEMSATALSRMIPAIKNNAFAVAKAIKVEPEALRSLFEAGRGMEAILMIFQHIKDSGMDADSIEKLLGLGGMQEVMKELNQQGARAGIVFAGLSQNVDELRRQLGVANEAYEENLAIQQEYEKMNETAAAKWARLKNEFEEAFVSDFWQRQIGNIIEFLRVIANLLTGNVHPALQLVTAAIHTFIVYWAVLKAGIGEAIFVKAATGLKAMGSGLTSLIADTRKYIKYTILLKRAQDEQTKAAITARMAQEGLNKAMIANVWTAVAMAIMTAVYALYHWIQNVREAAIEAGRLEAQVQKDTKAANKLIDAVGEARVKIEEADKSVRKARKELEEAKKANDGTTEAVKRLKDAEVELAVQEEKKRKALVEHKYMIEQFNNQYSKYLGFMLSEVASNIELANARDLVNSKLRETISLKQQEAGLERVEKEYGESRDERYGRLKNLVYDRIKDPTKAARAMRELTKAAQEFDDKGIDKALAKYGIKFGQMQQAAWDYKKELKNIKDANDAVIANYSSQASIDREASQKDYVKQVNSAFRTYNKKLGAYRKASGDDRAKAAAEVLQQMDTLKEMQQSASSYYKIDSTEEGRAEEARYKKQMGSLIAWQGYDRNALLKEAGKYYTPRKTTTGEVTTNIKDQTGGGWGSDQPAESTDWKNMTAEQLVNRRKQMKDFVNAIQTDTDVQSVLKEDAALKAAIERGMSSDMRTVIEWYNTERLKIQDELHARHLTNTGDWLDPKKEKGARKQFRDEMDAYLHELDAYYTERKTRIEEAGTDEGLTEAEIRNRTLNNEMEWQQRRAELQKLYSRKQKEVTEEEMDAIYRIIAERTGDSESFVKAQIARTNQFVDVIEKSGERGAAIVHRWMSQVELDTERSYLKGQQALTKQMRAVEAIIDKERPFNGITKSLQESLSTMDILTGEMRKEYSELMKQGGDMTGFNNRQAQEELKRTAFLLGEAENAYSTTADRVMDDMRQKGMTAWADWLSADPKLQEALMAQLRSTYDAIQDAIKKEASQLKKQAEIMWNNILMPDGKTTLKQTTDRVIAQLGLDEGRVKRANSLTGAGQASERVADRLAIQQMKVQMAMQEHYYNLMRKQGQAHVDMLKAQARAAKERGDEEEATRKTLDAQHAQMSLNLATAKEETELAKQREDITARTEESQNRLYTELKSWADLLTSSLQSLFEASNAGNAEYYNERAKLDLTGKGGPGAGTYTVIEDAGTGDARAHYEYLDERQALERQHEIEVQNAQADAWKKIMDDINMKLSETITDQLNAMLQAESIDKNTQAVIANTEAIYESMGRGGSTDFSDADRLKRDASGMAVDESGQVIAPIQPAEQTGEAPSWKPFWQMTEEEKAAHQENMAEMFGAYRDLSVETETEKAELLAEVPGYAPPITALTEEQIEATGEMQDLLAQKQIEADNKVAGAKIANQTRIQTAEQQAENQMAKGSRNMYAAMTSAANLYGAAYQAMTNDNLSAAQKFEMIALQAAGQSAMAMLQTKFIESEGGALVSLPELLAKCLNINPIAGAAIFAVLSALIGAGIGIAASNLSKSKSEIAKTTGASSASGGRLSTGMLTYKEGNVNEFTDPASLTPGRSYNVDAADGRTYRAKYTGRNPSTHLTGGPEFHLAGERGREMIIDADTTRQITMNEAGIWHAIQTLSGGGRLRHTQRRGRGVRAFADGNMDEFEEIGSEMGAGDSGMGGMGTEQMAAFQSSLDRNNELLERALTEGIHARFDVYGKGGLIDSYDTGKKTVARHGEKY